MQSSDIMSWANRGFSLKRILTSMRTYDRVLVQCPWFKASKSFRFYSGFFTDTNNSEHITVQDLPTTFEYLYQRCLETEPYQVTYAGKLLRTSWFYYWCHFCESSGYYSWSTGILNFDLDCGSVEVRNCTVPDGRDRIAWISSALN